METPKVRRSNKMRQFVKAEEARQRDGLEMIASENFTSREVMRMMGSVLTNKYAEGYPGRRYYGGCEEAVDPMETAVIDLAKQLFGAEAANVQPHDGSGANRAMYRAAGVRASRPDVDSDRDVVVALGANVHHLTHGMPVSATGKSFEYHHYGIDQESLDIDIEEARRLVNEHRGRVKFLLLGHSSYPRAISSETYAALRQIADDAGIPFGVDMAHFAGLVAAGVNDSPVPHASMVSSTTHKSLRGPRAGLLLCEDKYRKPVNQAVFPAEQGGPHEHIIAAKGVCFEEALQPEFNTYGRNIIANTQALVEGLAEHGIDALGGREDANHLCLVRVTDSMEGPGAKLVEKALDQSSITVNKNMAPFETRRPMDPSCIRVGTPALTTRGMGPDEMRHIAGLMAPVIKDPENESLADPTKQQVKDLTAQFPVPADFQY